MALKGKGLWAYRLWELDLALQLAPEMGITHILYKVGQGPRGGREGYYISSAASLAQKILKAGLIPMAWTFLTLGDPEFEAQMVGKAFGDGYQGFVFDMEDATRGRQAAALSMANRLRELGSNPERLYLCSYPTPLTLHSDLPYNALGPLCQGGLMPMTYGSYQRPPEIVIDRWAYNEERQWMQQQGLVLPIYPVLGPYYDELGSRRMTREELQRWLDRLAAYRPSFFSLFTAATIDPEHFIPVRSFSLGEIDLLGTGGWIRSYEGGVIYGEPGVPATRRGAVFYRSRIVMTGERTTATDGTAWVAVRAGDLQGWVPEGNVSAADPGPWPVLPAPPAPAPGQVLTVWSLTELNLRSEPRIALDTLLGRVPKNTRLRVAEDPEGAAGKLGRAEQWIRVAVEPGNFQGWAAAWYLTARDPNPTSVGIKVWVNSPEAGYLNVREQPSTQSGMVGQVADGVALEALESETEVQRKVGRSGQWIRVRLSEGREGYAAAWYLKLSPGDETEKNPYVIVKSAELGLRVRQGRGTHFGEVDWVPHDTALESLEEPAATAAKIGKQGNWLHVRTPARKEGYVAAWYVRSPAGPDSRQPVTDEALSRGESPYLFGVSAGEMGQEPAVRAPLRELFTGAGKSGWILFSQTVGMAPEACRPDPALGERLQEWARLGYGIVIRLSYKEPPGGTLPESSAYDAFAATCARWVELVLKRSNAEPCSCMIQVGRAPNDLEEHPGGPVAPREHITPQRYAEAFNRVYTRIKGVLPQAQVLAAAPDPYQAPFLPLLGNRRYKPLLYFQEMVEALAATDGFALEVATHGMAPESITHLLTFQDPFLADHYFDFQAFRSLMARIPARWKAAPVLITAARPLCPLEEGGPACDTPSVQGWADANQGWIQAAYAEIQRWNQTPYAQQIRGMVLERWAGGAWGFSNKPGVLVDFRQALTQDYRWRR